jgi:ATP-dependent exoDNAse (exonuclease V) beta subunit
VAADVPFRPETSSLVYATQEVRDVLAGVRAVVDPTNSVDVVAALRSALFAVGDDDLLTWKLAGGSWDYRVRDLEDPGAANPRLVDGQVVDEGPAGPRFDDLADHPVAQAFGILHRWHQERWWTTPADLIDRMVRDRRLREAALAEPRPRDRWRRYRFLAEQAREFAETQGGDLHDFVAWVEIQSSDMARVTEPIPPEPDDDAVRVLTMHGSKGLEFPIVVLAGAPTVEASVRPGPRVLFPPGRRPEVTLGADRQTADYDVHASMEEILDAHERVRLHYVAATRARDHLVVSVHHKEGGRPSMGRRTWELLPPADPDGDPQGGAGAWQRFERRGDERYAARPPTQLRLAGGGYDGEVASWRDATERIEAEVDRVRPRSASGLAAGSIPAAVSAPADEMRPRPQGAAAPEPGAVVGGTDLGLAVHAVLEVVDFAEPGDVAALAAARADEFGVPELAAEVERRVQLVLGTDTIDLARRNQHHRELPVVAPVGDSVVEGIVDLCIETDDGLLIVDYKTDQLHGPDLDAAAAAKAAAYRLQGATYALLLARLTGRPVAGCRFVFVTDDRPIEIDLPDLDRAMDDVVQAVAGR